MKQFCGYKLLCLLLAIMVSFTFVSCNNEGETVIITCNELPITESTFLMLMTEQALSIVGQEGVTEENLVEKAKQETLTYLPAYTYYVQGYQSKGYTLSDDDQGRLRANALAALLENGFAYDTDNRDEVFLQTFGATFEQYMQFQEQSYLISYFYQEEVKKIEVTEEETKAYFKANQPEYAICTAEIFCYPNTTEGITQANKVETALKNGESFDSCKELGGWEKAETLTFDKVSNLDASFGETFVTTMISAQQGDVKVFQTDVFITVARLKTLSGYTDHLTELQDALKEELYAKQLAEIVGTEAYIPKIVNQEVYDGITEIPGKGIT